MGPDSDGLSVSELTLERLDRPDGKSYVDAVTAAGQRSRALIYFIVILTVLTFAALRNSYAPDWTEQRYRMREAVFACYVHHLCGDLDDRLVRAGLMRKNAIEGERNAALQTAAKALDINVERLQANAAASAPVLDSAARGTDPGNWARRELVLNIENLIKKDIDNDTITLPLLGSSIDINDLWIVSGGLMFFLLYFLRVSQKQEERNIKYIHEEKREFGDLVAMNQVLSPHAIGLSPFGKSLEWLFGLLPSFLYFYLAYLDWQTIQISLLYTGEIHTYVAWGIELFLTVVVIYNNVRCLQNQNTIRSLIRDFYEKPSGLKYKQST